MMCEPHHSIIQYDDPNDRDDPDSGLSAQGGFSINQLTSGLTKWAKKIKRWFHLSAMGSGHSETIGQRSLTTMWHYSDMLRLFEADWWCRKVRLDGSGADKVHLECATEYANLVSIGNLTQLRRFLEESMKNSNRSWLYFDAVRNKLLTSAGRSQFDSKFQRVFKKKLSHRSLRGLPPQSLINFTVGWTRKRGLLVPEWADDDGLWK